MFKADWLSFIVMVEMFGTVSLHRSHKSSPASFTS